METVNVPPFAYSLVDATRSFGYSFETAIADIIDNCISAAASEIRICFSSIEPQWLCIEDDGRGMERDELIDAMRYGNGDVQKPRSKYDLGRFGLGMKTASLSQCRKLTVMTRQNGKTIAATWDLDYIAQTGDWTLKVYGEEELKNIRGYEYLCKRENGTVVVWEQLDRMMQGASQAQKAFDEKIEQARDHVALVFHRFIGDDIVGKKITIYFNGEPVVGVDPFLSKNPATQPLTEQIIRIGTEAITVKPFVLPYLNKLSKEEIRSIGGAESLRLRQGFYIYRNRRLIIWGTWFRLVKQSELGKLARVRVDIPNSLDSMWEIDVKKSTASLPYSIKRKLADIVENTVGKSERVYKYRGRNIQEDQLVHVWTPMDCRGQLRYIINRNLPIVKMIAMGLDEKDEPLLESFIKMLEDAFPFSDVYFRMAKNGSEITETLLGEEEVFEIACNMIHQIEEIGEDKEVFLKTMDQVDFFIKYPEVVRKVREEFGNE